MTLRLIHDKRHQASASKDAPIKRFRILKPGVYSSVAIQAEATTPGWTFAGVFDVLTFGDSSRRTSVIIQSGEIPLNREPFKIELGGKEVRYFAFDPYKGKRSFFNSIHLKVWVEDFDEELTERLPQGIEAKNGQIIITL